MVPSGEIQTISLVDVVAILRRRSIQISVTFVLTLAGVVAATLAMPKQYETQMKVLVKNERADMIVTPDRNGTPGFRGEVSENEINSEIELLTSNNLLRQVVAKCGLARHQQGSEPVAMERAAKRLQHDLKISPVRKANVILVEYADTDPHRAVTVLSSLADLYLEEHLKVHGSPGTFEFFQGQANRYQQELKDAEARVSQFRNQENIVMPVQQKDIALQKSAEAESALMQTEALISEYTQKIAGTRQQLAAAQPRVVTQTRTSSNQYSVERLHTMLAELANRRTLLLAKFQTGDRMVQEVEQEIADTQGALEKAKKLTGLDESTDVNPLFQTLQIELAKQETELAGARSRRDELLRQTGLQRRRLMTIANASTTFDDLLRTQKEAEENYLLYTKKTEEARITESLDKQKIANVAIAEAPIQPEVPAKPNVRLNVAVGGLLALFLSFGIAFAAEFFRTTVANARNLENLTGLPVLATSYGN